jgi:hypothetical protein
LEAKLNCEPDWSRMAGVVIAAQVLGVLPEG